MVSVAHRFHRNKLFLYATGVEGRAGMAAIVDEHHHVDLAELHRDLQKALPAYARPIFLRIIQEMDVTGTRNPGA